MDVPSVMAVREAATCVVPAQSRHSLRFAINREGTGNDVKTWAIFPDIKMWGDHHRPSKPVKGRVKVWLFRFVWHRNYIVEYTTHVRPSPQSQGLPKQYKSAGFGLQRFQE